MLFRLDFHLVQLFIACLPSLGTTFYSSKEHFFHLCYHIELGLLFGRIYDEFCDFLCQLCILLLSMPAVK